MQNLFFKMQFIANRKKSWRFFHSISSVVTQLQSRIACMVLRFLQGASFINSSAPSKRVGYMPFQNNFAKIYRR
jgi:hypothetical protein